MMGVTVISKDGFPHSMQSQSHRLKNWLGPDYVEVPPDLEKLVFSSEGYCDLIIENGVLVGITPKDKPLPPPEPPTEMEQLRADVDFLAAIGGVEL